MKTIKIFQIDAFTNKLFSGNPAAVCILENWITDELMQCIAAENNLAETAFVVAKGEKFEIRWFTPAVEVDLCGHATLATAFVLYNYLDYKAKEILFYSPRSGELRVSKQNDTLFLDFPTDILKQVNNIHEIKKCIGIEPLEVFKGKTDYIAVINNETEIKNLKPDLIETNKLIARGLIVTAKGDKADFVSRFFAPQVGINEDPVTGSAHTSLIPIWSAKLGKKEMKALQLSKRGGELICIDNGNRCLIGGQAKLYMTGEINIE
ncbi:MAG: isomerase [Bacteroidetes bacterium GWF2_33_16]|nr:MAG: isomerase [Bacteroidetes bacterium GWE2_32_14]OFY02259.1 MAG: isomerase [Bacteroidetes bacterium GWF2_33_16]